MCLTFVVFTDCESCTRPISTNSVSMEVGGRGRTRGTCFITCRLEVVAVAGLLCLSWCVFGGSDFLCFFFLVFLFFDRTRPTASMRPPCLIYLSTSMVLTNDKKKSHNCPPSSYVLEESRAITDSSRDTSYITESASPSLTSDVAVSGRQETVVLGTGRVRVGGTDAHAPA